MRINLLLSAFFLLSTGGFAQEPCFELFGDYNILCASEESETLWLGTTESGLLAFDKTEQSFVQYHTGNSNLGEDMVRSLLFYQDDLLISTDSSLYLFDNGDFLVYNDSLAGELLLNEGRLIVGGNSRYYELEDDVIVYEKDLLEEVVFSCDFCEQTTDMIIDNQGDVWLTHFGFYEFDILQFDGTEWTLHDHSTVSADIFPIESWNHNNRLCSYENQVLATSWAGMKVFENGTWDLTHTFAAPSIIEGLDTLLAPTALAADQNAGYWVGAMQNWQSMVSGKVAYNDGFAWQVFQPDLPGSTEFNRFYPSSDPQIIYAATNLGLVIIDKACLATSIPVSGSGQLALYPNPTQGNLRFNASIWGDLVVFDLSGRQLYSVQLTGENSIDIDHLQKGCLVVQITSKEETFKFSVIHQ